MLRIAKQRVKLGLVKSNEINVLSGVTYRTHLLPIPVKMFVNDINKYFQNTIFLIFPDDLNIFTELKSDKVANHSNRRTVKTYFLRGVCD